MAVGMENLCFERRLFKQGFRQGLFNKTVA